MVRMSGTGPVCLVHLVCLVYSVYLAQPNKQDKPNKPIKQGVSSSGVREAGGGRVLDRMGHG
jgi:hypothetical protein